jgi:hypothetical protein
MTRRSMPNLAIILLVTRHNPSCHTHALEPGGGEDAEGVLHDAEALLHQYMHTGGGVHAEPVLHKLVKVRQRHCYLPHRYTSLRVLQNGAIRTCGTLLACCTSYYLTCGTPLACCTSYYLCTHAPAAPTYSELPPPLASPALK